VAAPPLGRIDNHLEDAEPVVDDDTDPGGDRPTCRRQQGKSGRFRNALQQREPGAGPVSVDAGEVELGRDPRIAWRFADTYLGGGTPDEKEERVITMV
jgi:hypothetical protein